MSIKSWLIFIIFYLIVVFSGGTVIYVGLVGFVSALLIAFVYLHLEGRGYVSELEHIESSITKEQLDRIFSLVESAGGEPPNGGILVDSDEEAQGSASFIRIPDHLTGFPWAGQVYEINASETFEITRCANNCANNPKATQIEGRTFRFVGVPRERTKSGKIRNIFAPNRLLRASADLKKAIEDIYPEDPELLLSRLLQTSRDFRVGTSAAWMDLPQFQYCPKCKKRMVLVLQVPGPLFRNKYLWEGEFYLFGCKSHPDEMATVASYS